MKLSVKFMLNLASRIFFTLVSVVAGFFLIRHISLSDYAEISVYITILGFVPAIGLIGLIESLGKDIAEKGFSTKIFVNGFLYCTFIGMMYFVLMMLFKNYLAAKLNLNFSELIYFVLCLNIFLYIVNAYLEKVLEATSNAQVFSLTQMIVIFTRVIAVCLVVADIIDYRYIMISELIMTATYFLFYSYYIKKYLIVEKLKFSADFSYAKNVIKYGLAVYAASLFFLLTQKVPIFVTQALWGNSFVAYLNAPLNLIGRLYLPVFALSTVVAPSIVKATSQNKLKYLNSGILLILIVFIPISILMMLNPDKIVVILYGSKYLESAWIVRIFSCFLVVSSVNIYLSSAIQYLNLAKLRIKYLFFIAAADLGLICVSTIINNFVLVVWSFNITIVLLTFWDLKLLQEHTRISVLYFVKKIGVIFLASVPLFIAGLFYANVVMSGNKSYILYIICMLIMFIIYFLILLLTRVINIDNLLQLKSIFIKHENRNTNIGI